MDHENGRKRVDGWLGVSVLALNFHKRTNGMLFMVKYTVMKFLIIAIAFLTSSAYAAKVDLPRRSREEGFCNYL